MSELNAWDIVDANNNAAPPDGWPENTMQYSEVNNTGRAVQGTLKRYFADVNGSLQAAGVADAYTLTLNETGYSSYFAGMYFACEINATNTGASTIDVNGIGVQTIQDRAGNPLSPGELIAGGIYEFRYDGTNFQVMGTLAGTATTSELILTNSNDPDLVDTDVALNVGAANPDTAPHIEIGPTAIQSKSDQTTVNELELQSLGGECNLGQQTGTDDELTQIFQSGFQRLIVDVYGVTVRGELDGDPAVPDTIESAVFFESRDGIAYGVVGFDGSPDFELVSYAELAPMTLSGMDGVAKHKMFEGFPGGSADLYFDGANVTNTLAAAAGGLQANNTLTGAGFERVLTASDLIGVGGAQISGTPVNNQLAVWTNSTTIEGDANLTYDSATQQFELETSTANSIRIATTGVAVADEASLFIELDGWNEGVEFVQTDFDFEMHRTDGSGVQGNQLCNVNSSDQWTWYHAGTSTMRTTSVASGGVQVNGERNDGTSFGRVLIDFDDQFLEGRQPLGGYSSEIAGVTTTTIGPSNIKDFNGHCVSLTSGDSLAFGSISGGGTNEAGGTLIISSGVITLRASSISVDFWEVQASGVTYHNLSGTQNFTVTGPGIGAWRYVGTAQCTGFIFGV